tara:strand:- start:360 stop:1133 length:774 start_codon:yes stop_codon:yes gene_type:complete
MMSDESVLVEISNQVATVILNRPKKLNAIDFQLADQLHSALRDLDNDDSVRSIVLTGAGRAFSAGADLQARDDGETSGTAPSLSDRLFQSFAIQKPVIASINGVAVGGGCTMTLLCDIRIASDNARFQLPFAKLCLSAELGSTYILPRLIGLGRATELLLTSRTIDAHEAKEIGLVNRVVPASELGSVTQELAENIASFPPQAVRVNKKALQLGLNSDLESQRQHEELALTVLSKTEDAREAVAAFREKRDPIFKGR